MEMPRLSLSVVHGCQGCHCQLCMDAKVFICQSCMDDDKHVPCLFSYKGPSPAADKKGACSECEFGHVFLRRMDVSTYS
jgi:hypothetical protein